MSVLRYLTSAAAVAFAVACGGDDTSSRFAPMDIGAPVPEYSVRTLADDVASVGGSSNPVTLVNVWATWCAPCEREFPELQRLHEEYGQRGLRVLAVSIDRAPDATVEAFAAERMATFDIGRDPEGRVQTAFMTIGVPESFLVDANGQLRWRMLGELREGDAGLEAVLEDLLEPQRVSAAGRLESVRSAATAAPATSASPVPTPATLNYHRTADVSVGKVSESDGGGG